MNATVRRVVDHCRSIAGKCLLFALAICAPVHAALAQNVMTISSGDGQTTPAGNAFAAPLTVSFSGSSYVYLEWQVTSGDAYFEENGATTYATDLGGSIYVAALDGSGQRPIRALQGNLTGIAYAEVPDGSPA